ncbi:MAG: DUF1365 domain-containing protein [Alphaproteobacteria bacterium]|nr:DUF1365 domain-containing protein [Alphaproteobacteria bacterium]
MTSGSALYVGRVTHHRLRPRRHSLAYRAWWLLLDLDEIDAIAARLAVFSRNRLNIFSFYDADHGSGSGALRSHLQEHLAKAGIDIGEGPIRLLAMPRLLGYVFNPLSVYFCYKQDGALAALVYEVNNTFGERHSYLIGASSTGSDPVKQHCNKRFYVSPFLGMNMRYDFTVAQPGRRTAITVRGSDESGTIIVATLSGVRRPLTDWQLIRVLATHPLVQLKVTLGIHWEALRLWLKGIRLHNHPPPPDEPVTSPPPRIVRGHL